MMTTSLIDHECPILDSDNNRLIPPEWDEWEWEDSEWVRYPLRGVEREIV